MDIRNLKTFIRAAELGSMTKAAEEMGFVQSTVSMQIQQMEGELGYPLFDRIGKKVSLTSLGEEFLANAYEIVNLMEKASSPRKKGPGEMKGTLRVGVLESLLFSNLLAVLPRFKEKFKNVDLRLKMGQTKELVQKLKQNQLDLVYLSDDLNTDEDLCCCHHHEERIVFICGPGHRFSGRKKVLPGELFQEEFVVTERSGICYGKLRALAAQHSGILRDSVEVDSTVAIADVVQKGMGVAFLPEYSVKKMLEQGTLIKINPKLPTQTYYSQILCHKKRWISPFMNEFIEMVDDLYKENGDL